MTPDSAQLLASPPCGSGIRLGLSHVRELSELLGSPQLSIPIVLVGGTNGKGSTTAMLAAICERAGYRTGRFTSPHLETAHERITVDGEAIEEEALAFELARILLAGEADPPTPFEALTLAAWSFFKQQRVDIAIMEVGLGGRLDATNACEPILSIITSIAIDHQHFLGASIDSIAAEKMGITRRNITLVTACSTNDGGAYIHRRARDLGIPLIDADGMDIDRLEQYRKSLVLSGAHQLSNLALAASAAEHLATCGWPALDTAAITAGIASCRWPGRCEWVQGPHEIPVLLDVAHNPAAATCLAAYMKSTPRAFDLVFGVLSDKNADEMLEALRPVVDRIVLTKPSDPRALDPGELAKGPRGLVIVDPRRAIRHAISKSSGSAILVCGSHSLVGEIRGLLVTDQR